MLRQGISSIFAFFALKGSSFDKLLCSGKVKCPIWVVYNDTNLLRLCLPSNYPRQFWGGVSAKTE
jgi:hypothetical protein